MQKLFLSILISGFFLSANCQSPNDTLHLSVRDAEKIFLQKNLSLLAARFDIDANHALEQQAKLWNNPVLSTDQDIYDGKFFRHNNPNGQVYVQVQQLLLTAGKRNRQVQLAKDNTTISQDLFDELVRTLMFTLHSDMLEGYKLNRIIAEYSYQVNQVSRLVAGMDEVYKAGNISLKDDLRLKASLFTLQNEEASFRSQIIPIEQELKMLLQVNDNSFILPEFQTGFDKVVDVKLPIADSLVHQAMNNRPEKKLAETNLLFQQHNLLYQKALAKPDLTIGTEYDQHSSYQPNYWGLSVSLPIPIFNRNQGNIKASGFAIQHEQTMLQSTQSNISIEVMSSVNKFSYLQQLNNAGRINFYSSYEKMFQNMIKSYEDRQISLLDLTDFLDSFKNTRLQLLEQQFNLLQAAIELNYVVNANIIPIQ